MAKADNQAHGEGGLPSASPASGKPMAKKPKRLPLLYETHAVNRMNERSAYPQEVEPTIRNPDRVEKAKRPGAEKYSKKHPNGKTLVVVAEKSTDFIRVVTTWWT